MAGAEAPDAEARPEPGSAEEQRRLGGEAYAQKDFAEAVRCYTSALEKCPPGSDLAAICLNNRAACHAQLKDHRAVVRDASDVIKRQPANVKALLRRMVALDTLGERERALADAGSVLTIEPKNAHALQVVEKKRKSLTKKATDALPARAALPTETLCVFLFSEDRPLQCYACLRSLQKHLRGANLSVHIFFQASDKKCMHSYQLLQTLPETSQVQHGKVLWMEASKGQLFKQFSRTINRMSVEGQSYVLMLSDTVVFHTAVDVPAALKVLGDRREVFSVRLDVNPRIDSFPEAKLVASAPNMQNFAGDPRVLLWTRTYDKSKMAFEAVPREEGWDAILNWTATIVRTEHVQHFFSALLPPLDTVTQLDEKAADWLSRRQRMAKSEIVHKSACFERPSLVAIDAAEFGDAAAADMLLRAHLLRRYGIDGSAGSSAPTKFAERLGWSLSEVMGYFKDVSATSGTQVPLEGLLEPELYATHYLTSVQVPARPPTCSLPKAPEPPAPLVSWLVPARNAEAFVRDAFSSIEAQHGIGAGCYEVVFVDDGSEDSTLPILRQLAADKPHVRVVDNGVQLGVAGSLCEGWRRCRGEFVARLDVDDEAEPDRLVKQLRYLEQHKTISVVGGRTRPFWCETRRCTIEKLAEKDDGRVVATAWREFHGNQTTRQREQLTLCERGDQVIITDAPAELVGCKVVKVGDESLAVNPSEWRTALKAVQGGLGDVILQRRDELEPPAGSRALHPLVVRATLPFEDCIAGTTAMLRRPHFPEEEGPFPREEAEGHWCWLSLGQDQHAANLADALVRTRRHDGQRTTGDAADIYESRCAAVQHHLTKAYAVDVDMQDAAALLNFRGPRTPEQGEKLLGVLEQVAHALIADYVRPRMPEGRGPFFQDFVRGAEVGLERAVMMPRARFQKAADEVSRVITKGESPRDKRRSRTPPR